MLIIFFCLEQTCKKLNEIRRRDGGMESTKEFCQRIMKRRMLCTVNIDLGTSSCKLLQEYLFHITRGYFIIFKEKGC